MTASKALPIVYACSGPCSTGQMANYIALCLHRARVAKMSSTAGVGGAQPAMVAAAKSGRTVVAIDGCERHCTRRCLARQGIAIHKHYAITDFEIEKHDRPEFDEDDAVMLFEHIRIALTG
jgi:uncharacterized metal-binding protein